MEQLGKWMVDYGLYGLLFISTVFGGYWLLRFRDRLRLQWWQATLLAVFHTLVGVLCVKVFAFLESGDMGKMSLFGAVFFLPVLYFLGAKLFKRSVADVFDVFTICVIFTLLCARINCIITGCCLGKCIPGTDALRWPTRELEVLFYVLLLLFLWKRVGTPENRGTIYPLYMFAYGIFRFVVELFRESAATRGLLHISHLWAVICAIIGMSVYFELKIHRKQNSKKRR